MTPPLISNPRVLPVLTKILHSFKNMGLCSYNCPKKDRETIRWNFPYFIFSLWSILYKWPFHDYFEIFLFIISERSLMSNGHFRINGSSFLRFLLIAYAGRPQYLSRRLISGMWDSWPENWNVLFSDLRNFNVWPTFAKFSTCYFWKVCRSSQLF